MRISRLNNFVKHDFTSSLISSTLLTQRQ
jgi:hypothetical protein